MNAFRDLLKGLLMALTSSLVVMGAFILSLAEGKSWIDFPPIAMATQVTVVPFPTWPTPASAGAVTSVPTVLPSPLASLLPGCPTPAGWQEYAIKQGDTLQSLSERFGASPEDLRQGNCLMTNSLIPGTLLYVPPQSPTETNAPEATAAVTFCGPPSGWVTYVVQPSDTLFALSLQYGVSVPQLQLANCLGNSTVIRYGASLFVPYARPVSRQTYTAAPPTVPSATHTPETPQATTQPPGATQSPEITPNPVDSQSPGTTQSPDITQLPDVTQSPDVTQPPDVSFNPVSFTIFEAL